MKLAEVLARYLESLGIRHVFGVSGGASLHLIHGIADASKIQFVPTTHECNAGFAADAYARLTGFGCAIATSGPGATNLVTAIASSYYDSVPVLFITGNVATHRASAPLQVRQYGFQDAPICDIVRGITKHAVQLRAPSDLWEVGRLVAIAKHGRPGPVLLDIPDDLQRADVPEDIIREHSEFVQLPEPDIGPVVRLLSSAQRPVFVWGAGMRAYAAEARALAERLSVPVVTTWGAIDCLPHDHPLMFGGFGTHGTRCANFVYQNADLLICLGTRLDTKATGSLQHWAREAKVVMVDVDMSELLKFDALGRPIDKIVHADVGRVLDAMRADFKLGINPYHLHWGTICDNWRYKYTAPPAHEWSGTDPYELMQEIAKWTTPEDIIVSDTGTALGYLMQGFPFKGERFLHAFNMTPMGYGLPAAIGAAMSASSVVNGTGRVILLTGDGSILMSLSELATVARWNLPIKVILLDNGGHAMCRQTERQWLGGKYVGTDVASGLGMPADWDDLVDSFGIRCWEEHHNGLANLMFDNKTGFLRYDIDPDAGLIPQAKYGQPLEDADPQLPREEFLANMIVRPVDA